MCCACLRFHDKNFLINCRNSPDSLIGYDDNLHVLEHCLLKCDLTSLISQGKRGGLLRQVGQLIQVKHNLKVKYDATAVQLSKRVFDLVGAKL